MALKHWTGTIREPAVVWHCPTCGAENAGPLVNGCTACKAGADAKAASEQATAQRVVEAITQRREERSMPIPAAKVDYPAPPSFVAWWDSVKGEALKLNGYEIARLAYQAGAAWQASEGLRVLAGRPVDPQVSPVKNSASGWSLRMIQPGDDTPDEDMDARQHATILAALAFYRDNQLAYGLLPGQLSAEEVTELITKLSPQEQEA